MVFGDRVVRIKRRKRHLLRPAYGGPSSKAHHATRQSSQLFPLSFIAAGADATDNYLHPIARGPSRGPRRAGQGRAAQGGERPRRPRRRGRTPLRWPTAAVIRPFVGHGRMTCGPCLHTTLFDLGDARSKTAAPSAKLGNRLISSRRFLLLPCRDSQAWPTAQDLRPHVGRRCAGRSCPEEVRGFESLSLHSLWWSFFERSSKGGCVRPGMVPRALHHRSFARARASETTALIFSVRPLECRASTGRRPFMRVRVRPNAYSASFS